MSDSHSIDAGFARVADVARALGVSVATVQRWIREGRLPAVHLGRLVLVPEDALRLLVERQERSGQDG
jgi:excisionase family DNA binding protein